MQVWALAIYALAVARVTGLIAADAITEPVREAIRSRLDPSKVAHRLADDLLTCQWCLSCWLAFPAALLVWSAGTSIWLLVPAYALAVSQVTGMMSRLGRS